MPLAIHLDHRVLISVTGEDARSFLEGLVTSELPLPGIATGSALLTPQGKILFSFLLSNGADGFAIECDARERDPLIKRLSLYKLRAKVNLEPVDAPVHAVDTGGLTDLRHPSLGGRVYGQIDANDDYPGYTNRRITAGVLEGPDEILAGQDFPHDVALDVTASVSFKKGCFVGQEVVSRVKHRGTARRRPAIVEGSSLEVGAAVKSGERELGTVRCVEGNKGLAVIRIDQVKGQETVGDAPVNISPPEPATYTLGSA